MTRNSGDLKSVSPKVDRDKNQVIIISAMSSDRVIGVGEGMPWDVPAEYQQYLEFVKGNTVVMGRRTFEIFGPDLPATTTAIVVTRSNSIGDAIVASSLEDAVARAREIGRTIFIAGGHSIYQQALSLADALYLSTIKGNYDGDTYFPDFDLDRWEVVEEQENVDFVFRKYVRKARDV